MTFWPFSSKSGLDCIQTVHCRVEPQNVLLVSHCCLYPVTLMHLPIDHLSVRLSLSTLWVAQKAGVVEILFSSSALCVSSLRIVCFFFLPPSHRFSLCESLLLLLLRLSASLIHPPGGRCEPLLSDASLFFFLLWAMINLRELLQLPS